MDMIGHNSRANPGNWIAVSRDMRDHEVVGMGQPVRPADPGRGSYSRYEAWQDLLMEAQWKPFEVINRGKSVTLRRGQLMAARSWLAARWNWSEKTVRVFITQLEEEFMVRAEASTASSRTGRYNNILTICNYDIYQTVYELMHLSDIETAKNQGPDERPDEGPDKGPDETTEKPFNYNVISLAEVKKGPDERPDEGPDKGPQYNNVKNNVLREREARAREDGSSRMPENWYLPNEWGQWAMHHCKRDRDWVIAAAAKFKDYWLSVPDSKGFKKNWRSTWQNWCRNTLTQEAKYGPRAPKKQHSSKQAADDAWFDKLCAEEGLS
jgi:hypothetical protein